MSEFKKNRLETLGFKVNHFALIGFFTLFILGTTFMKDPLLFENIFTLKFLKAEGNTPTQQVVAAAETQPVSYDGINDIVAQKNEMMGLLDPSFGEGSVLGASTEAQESVQDILSAENISKIPIKETSDAEKNITSYIDKISLVESYYGQTLILSAISTKDPAAAQKSIPLITAIIGDMKSISVPTSFAHYHRLKLMQNAVLLNMANTIASSGSSKDQAAAGVLFFEITNELENERAQLINQFSYSL